MHPFSLPPRGHQPRLLQISQMARDLRLVGSQHLLQMADADFATLHQAKQPQSRRVRQGGKETGRVKHARYIRIDEYDDKRVIIYG